MQPKLIDLPLTFQTDRGVYQVATWGGENESGLLPEGDRVLILPDQAAEQSHGGVYLTEEQQERVTAAAESGVLVALGPDAFLWNSDRSRRRESPGPEVGVRVVFERYSGQIVHGIDGKIYRLMDDKAIGGISTIISQEEDKENG